ncbi:MAG: CPBP family intramembrane glutamic endopeptidase [Niameybacter sp.]|uniref:CPBP family intramembrane glutamic endopeptidase n=1 Tax=Niameybacter sp. TaxID=2033640 RepID=UPI002FC95C5D
MDYSNIGFVFRGAIMQIIVFSAIPFIWWRIKHKKEVGFREFIGLTKPISGTTTKNTIIALIAYWIIWGMLIFIYGSSGSSFYGMGVKAIIPALIVCFLQNGLCEEILLRGFLLKRLCAKMNFLSANSLHALIFALLHIGVIGENSTLLGMFFILLKPFVGGWMLGYVSQKLFKGSIIPSVILHGLGNYILRIMDAFMLL